MRKVDFKKDLNKEQLAAATAPEGRVLVLAAAGTGKTRTLVYRVAYLVETGVGSDRILLLTFTNRAAREMLERAQKLVGPGVGGVWGGTFHHFANRILRRHAPLLGFRCDYTILDRDDSRSLVANCVKDLDLNGKEFPKPDVLVGLFSASTNTETPLDQVVEARMGDFVVEPRDIVRVWEEYRKRKRKLDAMDFDDLLVNCRALFRDSDEALGTYRRQFVHVLVDEYQDTNTIQAELVDMLAECGNLLVVGDDFQSIYSWRGADFRNIMSFPRRYPDALSCKLETNYRSVPEILAVANACIAGNPEQFQKTLRPTREACGKPRVAKMRDGAEQARYVVDLIVNLQREGYRLSDIGILYRAHFHAMELQMELTRQRVPYVITSGARFFEQVHVKDVCSVLRLLENASDELAFLRLVGLLTGVGPRTAARIWNKLGGRFDAQEEGQRKLLREALRGPAHGAWEGIEHVLTAYKDEDLSEDGGEVIHRFVEAFYGQYLVNSYENHERRADDIRELMLYTANFESVERFLSDVALLTNLDAEVDSLTAAGHDALRLSTVHQAKGLEWSVVIVLWVAEGMFPSARSLKDSLSGESEERRLFYVAVTRAKDELHLCVPEVRRRRDGGVTYCSPSRFVDEIPQELVEEVRPSLI